GVPNVIRTGQPELFAEIPAELLREATADTPELLETLEELGLKSSMCVPLIARQRTLGAITFVSAESGRRYSEADLATAQDLARRAAISIDNARLFRDAQASRQHAQESLAVVDAVFAAAPVGLAFMDTNFRYVDNVTDIRLLNHARVMSRRARARREAAEVDQPIDVLTVHAFLDPGGVVIPLAPAHPHLTHQRRPVSFWWTSERSESD